MTKYALIILTVFFFACSHDSGTDSKKIKDKKVSLDSLADRLFAKYPDYSQSKKNPSPSTAYKLVSRHFYPSLDSLTFELRQYTDCGGCWEHQFIYIYNDSTEFALPLIDNYYYWLASSDRQLNIDSLKNKFCLQTEINNALRQFNLKDNLAYDNIRFVDIIMDLMGYQPVFNWDIPKMKEFSKGITQDSFLYNSNCKTKFLDNLKTIENELNSHPKKDRKVYSNFRITYFVDFGQQSINLTVFNFECNAQIIF